MRRLKGTENEIAESCRTPCGVNSGWWHAFGAARMNLQRPAASHFHSLIKAQGSWLLGQKSLRQRTDTPYDLRFWTISEPLHVDREALLRGIP